MKEGDDNLFFNLIRRDWAFPAIVFSLLGLIGGAIIDIPNPILLAFGLFIFTAFDMFGYESVAHSTDRDNLVRYRIIQTVFQWTIFLVLGLITHWNLWTTLGFIYLWWNGCCDVLYYIFLGRLGQMRNYGDMFWLWWTPIGIFNRLFNRNTGGKDVLHVTIFSAILWYGLWVAFPSIRLMQLF